MNLCPKGHDKDVVGRTKRRQCRACKNDRNRRYNAAHPRKPGRYVPKGRPTGPDGFEDEYGPVPDWVPNTEWYDEVIVRRALLGYPTGRSPYPLEQAEIIRRMTPDQTQAEIAQWCGVDRTTFNEWVTKYGGVPELESA